MLLQVQNEILNKILKPENPNFFPLFLKRGKIDLNKGEKQAKLDMPISRRNFRVNPEILKNEKSRNSNFFQNSKIFKSPN